MTWEVYVRPPPDEKKPHISKNNRRVNVCWHSEKMFFANKEESCFSKIQLLQFATIQLLQFQS
jgi:hypothetical protein